MEGVDHGSVARQMAVWVGCTGALFSVAAFNRLRDSVSRQKMPKIKLVERDGDGHFYEVLEGAIAGKGQGAVIRVQCKEDALVFIEEIPRGQIRSGDRLFLVMEACFSARLPAKNGRSPNLRYFGYRAWSGIPS
jgi:hypothetical protein